MHVEDLKILCQNVRQYFENILMLFNQSYTHLGTCCRTAKCIHYPSSDQIDQVCVTNDDRPEQEAIIYTVTRRENIYIPPALDPEYSNALAEYVPPLSKFL